MSETIKVFPVKGSTVYKLDGTQGTYIEELSTGEHLVSVVYYIDNQLDVDEFEFDVEEVHIEIWDKVYSNPPRAQREEQITRLESVIDSQQEELSQLYDNIRLQRQELYNLDAKHKARLEAIKQHKALANLELFLQGKITHFLKVSDSSYEIVDFKEGLALSEANSRYDKHKFKLLTLYGRTDGNLEWNINEYSSDSCNKQLVYPCISYEDAEAKVLEIWHEKLASLKLDDYGLIPICETAKKLGIPLKEDVASWCKEAKTLQISNGVDGANKQIDNYRHNIKLLEGRLVGLQEDLAKL